MADLTARARLRDAAIRTVAESGIDALTARRAAQAAGVSPGLVAHHFGSMQGLRRACDEHVARMIRDAKTSAIEAGSALDPLAALRDPDLDHLGGYLAAVLTEDSPAVADLVDDLVADAEAYLELAEDRGQVRPTDDPRRRASVLLLWSLGMLAMRSHARRLLGVDPADTSSADDEDLLGYARASWGLLADGLFTADHAPTLTGVQENAS